MLKLDDCQHGLTDIYVIDEPSFGNAYHQYVLFEAGSNIMSAEPFAAMEFQRGAIKEHGVNGIQIEDLLHICKHRLECFQSSEFACRENKEALEHINIALEYLNMRPR